MLHATSTHGPELARNLNWLGYGVCVALMLCLIGVNVIYLLRADRNERDGLGDGPTMIPMLGLVIAFVGAMASPTGSSRTLFLMLAVLEPATAMLPLTAFMIACVVVRARLRGEPLFGGPASEGPEPLGNVRFARLIAATQSWVLGLAAAIASISDHHPWFLVSLACSAVFAILMLPLWLRGYARWAIAAAASMLAAAIASTAAFSS